MSKVFLISRRPKLERNTAQLMEECAKVIREKGVQAEIVSFADMKIESCRACGKCSEMGKCNIEDGLNDVMDKLRESQGFIVGAPV